VSAIARRKLGQVYGIEFLGLSVEQVKQIRSLCTRLRSTLSGRVSRTESTNFVPLSGRLRDAQALSGNHLRALTSRWAAGFPVLGNSSILDSLHE
jgi:hypothetical protein